METELCLGQMLQLRLHVSGFGIGDAGIPCNRIISGAHMCRSWTGEGFWGRVGAWETDPLAGLLWGGSGTRHIVLACSTVLIHILVSPCQAQSRGVGKLCCSAAGVGGGRQWSRGHWISSSRNHSLFCWVRKKSQEQTKGRKGGKISKPQRSRATLFVVSEIQIDSSGSNFTLWAAVLRPHVGCQNLT